MRVHAHIPIGEIAASLPHVTKLLDVLGIDYVCHGDLSLRDACAEAGVDPSLLRIALDNLPRDEADRANWADASLEGLLIELRSRRHPKMRTLLARTAAVLAETPDIVPLRTAFHELCEVLQPHMTREEHTLFPVVQHLEDCWSHNERLAVTILGGIRETTLSLFDEHVRIMQLLRCVHDAACGVRNHATNATNALNAVAELEHELREHIHLENNVLFPRAVAIEAAITTSSAGAKRP